jgi:peptidoglycan/LPS O-acetylase OafA/YrhL
VPLALAACAVLFALFEKPFMRRGWVDDVLAWFGRRPAGAPPAKPVAVAEPAPPAPGPGGLR